MAGGSPAVVVNVHWPLYTVYPGCTILFWFLYLIVTPRLSSHYVAAYDSWMPRAQMVWGQVINYLIHSILVIIPLISVLAKDGAALRDAGLYPYYSEFAYVDVCLSLGYMSFTLPWSINVYFVMKRRDMGTNRGLIIHHCAVVVAEVVYLLTQVAPWYGAISLILFELSNLNAAPHLLMTQLQYTGRWHFLNGLCFLVTFTGSRIIACTVVGILYTRDYASLDSEDAALWVTVGLSLASYWVLMALSYFWFYRDVMTVAHAELKRYLGDEYWRRCLPCAPAASARPNSSTTSKLKTFAT